MQRFDSILDSAIDFIDATTEILCIRITIDTARIIIAGVVDVQVSNRRKLRALHTALSVATSLNDKEMTISTTSEIMRLEGVPEEVIGRIIQPRLQMQQIQQMRMKNEVLEEELGAIKKEYTYILATLEDLRTHDWQGKNFRSFGDREEFINATREMMILEGVSKEAVDRIMPRIPSMQWMQTEDELLEEDIAPTYLEDDVITRPKRRWNACEERCANTLPKFEDFRYFE